MGALGHFLEKEGIATTQISLIRPHTEKIRPPRALWVSFELGRPFGVPNEPDFQKQVLTAALQLLQEKQGPVLADFPEDAPALAAESVVLACPYVPPADLDATVDHQLVRELKQEVTALQSWYQQVRGTAYSPDQNLSKLSLEVMVDQLWAIIDGRYEKEAGEDEDSVSLFRGAVEDLKAFYFTALSAQPGLNRLKGEELERWFWKETVAGRVLRILQKTCRESPDSSLKKLGRQIIPNRYRHDVEM